MHFLLLPLKECLLVSPSQSHALVTGSCMMLLSCSCIQKVSRERENANRGVFPTSSSFVMHRKLICANGQISRLPVGAPRSCLHFVFSLVGCSPQSSGEGLRFSKSQISHLLQAGERLQEKTTVKQGRDYLKLKAVTRLNSCPARHSLRTQWEALMIHETLHMSRLSDKTFKKMLQPRFLKYFFFPTCSIADHK